MDDQKRERLIGILVEEMKPFQDKLASLEKELKEMKEQQTELISLLKRVLDK